MRTAGLDTLDPKRAAHLQRLRGRIAFNLRRGEEGATLLRQAATQLEAFDVGTARETHLDALFAAIAVRSHEHLVAEAAAAALAARRRPGRPVSPTWSSTGSLASSPAIGRRARRCCSVR